MYSALQVVKNLYPDYDDEYARRGWRMFPVIGRVYVNEKARRELGWQPKYDFRHVLNCLKADEYPRSPLSTLIGIKGYHKEGFGDGIYPVG